MSTEINVKRRTNYFEVLRVTQNLKVNRSYSKKTIEYFLNLSIIYFEYTNTFFYRTN